MNNEMNKKMINKQAKESLGYLTGMDMSLQAAVLSMRLKSCGAKNSDILAKDYIINMRKSVALY